MISDDLSSLFAPNPLGLTQAFQICLGQVVAYNGVDGSNVVSISGGALLTNVPVMRVGASLSLTVGDTVIMARLGNSYIVLGAVVQSGVSNFSADNSVWSWNSNSVTGFGAAAATLVTCSVTAPRQVYAWAGQSMGSIKCAGTNGSLLQAHINLNWTDSNGVNQSSASVEVIESFVTGSLIKTVTPVVDWGGTILPGSNLVASMVLDGGIGGTDSGAAAGINLRADWGRIHTS